MQQFQIQNLISLKALHQENLTILDKLGWSRSAATRSTTLFSVSSTFTLAKTIRDNHEATKLVARIDEARVEKILTEHHPLE